MVYSFDLNVTPGGIAQNIKLSQYDKTIPVIQAILWQDNSGYSIPAGSNVYIAGTKPDKTGFEYACEYTGSTVTIEVTEQMTAVAGRVNCELIIMAGDGRKGSCNFFLDIEPAALRADIVPSETEIPIIEQIPEIVQEMENNVELAHQWATYGSESETPSETNNAKYWAEQSEQYAIGAFHWKGSVLFANIPTSGMVVGDLYDITDDFTTDNRFVEGAGIECAAGTDIVWSEGNKWDILTPATNASQVKYGNSDVKTELDQINTSLTDINADLSDVSNRKNLKSVDITDTNPIAITSGSGNIVNYANIVSAYVFTPRNATVLLYRHESGGMYARVIDIDTRQEVTGTCQLTVFYWE